MSSEYVIAQQFLDLLGLGHIKNVTQLKMTIHPGKFPEIELLVSHPNAFVRSGRSESVHRFRVVDVTPVDTQNQDKT
jgi:hypothetical protein